MPENGHSRSANSLKTPRSTTKVARAIRFSVELGAPGGGLGTTGLPGNTPDMTPIIDVVFLLLAFFMIAMNFENTKADERARLPKDTLAKPPTVKPEHEVVLTLGYQRDQDGRKLSSFPEVLYNERHIEVRDIASDLKQEKRVMERVYGEGVIKDVTVQILGDPDVPAGLIQELIKKCQQAGFSKFSLRANSEDV